MTPLEEMRQLMLIIITDDASLNTVRQLEALLVDHYADTRLFDELTEPLSQYSPGCGKEYYGAKELRQQVVASLNRLDYLASTPSEED
jgi:hypothetical protein